MIDTDVLNARLARLTSTLSILRSLAKTKREELLSDSIRLGAVKYYLLEAIQNCLDIGNHIIGSEGLEKPSRYSEVFEILANHDIIPQPFAEELSKMAAFRNRIVHIYIDFDNSMLYDILENNLNDFDRFAKSVHEFVKKSQ